MTYAVIALSGSQYQIKTGDHLTVNNLKLKPKDKSSTDKVLLWVGNGQVKIGQPTVPNAQVEFEVVKNYKGPKIRIFKYKAKAHYRRRLGFRPQLTDIKITNISIKKNKK